MRKTTAAVLMLVGGAALGSSIHDNFSKYKPDNIFSTQSTMVERRIRSPEEKKARIAELRAGLKDLEQSESRATFSEYCRFQVQFAALTNNKGDVKAAEAEIARRSLDPYSECEMGTQASNIATKGVNILSAVVFLTGLIGMAGSLITRKEHKP